MRSSVDGRLVRDSGPWAKDKLYYVGRYMSIFNGGMKNFWPQRGYIDLMAGPGVCKDRDSGDDSTARRCSRSQASHLFGAPVLVDVDADSASDLEARTTAHAERRTVLSKDSNAPATIDEVRQLIPSSMLTLCFVDNLGLSVTFRTLERLVAGGRPIDLLLTFAVSDLTRNADTARETEDGDRFDAFFGSPRWREVADRFDRGESARSDKATALADFYGEQLATLGYDNFEQLQRVMTNTKGAPLCRLVIASRHPRAIDFFRKISAIEHDGQRSFGW